MPLMPLTIYMQILTIYKHMCIPSLMKTQHIMSGLQRDQKMKLTIREKEEWKADIGSDETNNETEDDLAKESCDKDVK